MSEVPWAPGRKALVRWLPDGAWFEGVACVHEDGHVEGPVTDADRANIWHGGDLDVFAPDDEAETVPLPSQCPRCFAVGTHEDGCMVAANLARGVWAWLAPFVRQDPPGRVEEGEVFQVYPHGLTEMIDLSDFGAPPDWRVNGAEPYEDAPDTNAIGWVVLGPNGPTLAPWGKG